jgi:type I site-specific restriction endonuclease
MSKLNKDDLSLKEENKDNFKESLIERKNLTNEFTIASIEKHIGTLEKMQREIKGTVKLAKATVDNVLRNNEFIKEMSDEDQHAVWMHKENADIVKEGDEKLKVVTEELDKHNEYLDVIYDKFGFVKVEAPSKEHGPG